MLKLKDKIDFNRVRGDFPLIREGLNHGKPIVFLDSAASAQKPQQVIDAISQFYTNDYANIHRGIYELSARATDLYEGSRSLVKDFINARSTDEIIFVRGTTEAINLVAQSYGRANLQPGDEVIVTAMEHHSNIVPWFMLHKECGIVLKVVPVNDDGSLDIDAYKKLLSTKTRLVALTHVSNVLGTINPIAEMIALAHEYDVPVLVDGAQAAPYLPIDVQQLDCDFYTFSGHKLYGPCGIGVLYGKRELLAAMPPYQGGGSMIDTVSFSRITYTHSPQKFEAGTPHIAGAIGLGAAIDYVQTIGMQEIYGHGQELLDYAEPRLAAIPGLKIIGMSRPKVSLISFVMENVHPHDLGTVLDNEGIAIRAGHHCAMPLMERFNVAATARASFGIYNNRHDIDALINGILAAQRLFE